VECVTGRYFAAFFLLFASARRSVFLRRAARFLTLSLPWLFPIELNTHPSFAGSKRFRSSPVRKIGRKSERLSTGSWLPQRVASPLDLNFQ
jgi:hypothetical protein